MAHVSIGNDPSRVRVLFGALLSIGLIPIVFGPVVVHSVLLLCFNTYRPCAKGL